MELTKNGARRFLDKNSVSNLISEKLISGSALCIKEIPSSPVVLFTPSTLSSRHNRICSVLRLLIPSSISTHPFLIYDKSYRHHTNNLLRCNGQSILLKSWLTSS